MVGSSRGKIDFLFQRRGHAIKDSTRFLLPLFMIWAVIIFPFENAYSQKWQCAISHVFVFWAFKQSNNTDHKRVPEIPDNETTQEKHLTFFQASWKEILSVSRSDSIITEIIGKKFAKDPLLKDEEITLTVHHGTVILEGTVKSHLQKKRATIVVEEVKDVTNIINLLRHPIEWVWRSDFEIRRDIEDKLSQDPMMSNESIGVKVEGGMVTLEGRVTTWRQRRIAEAIAYETQPRSVDNRLHVKSVR